MSCLDRMGRRELSSKKEGSSEYENAVMRNRILLNIFNFLHITDNYTLQNMLFISFSTHHAVTWIFPRSDRPISKTCMPFIEASVDIPPKYK